jgi:hypothetical protein
MKSIADACREAWASRRVETIAGVADGLRLSHGFNYAQVHQVFCESVGFDIPLADFDLIMFMADEGYTGEVQGVRIRPPAFPDGRQTNGT